VNINGHVTTLSEVWDLLIRDGRNAVLLPIPIREKGPRFDGWQRTTFEHTQTKKYMEDLQNYPNTGVLLGDLSNGLCSWDWDTTQALDDFTRANPIYDDSLWSAAVHGAQIWAYFPCERPHQVHPLYVRKGSVIAGDKKPDKHGRVKVGEFRAEGGQSVIRGIHPEGVEYRILRHNVPITISDFYATVLHPDIIIPWAESTRTKAREESAEDHTLLKRAIGALSVASLWTHFGYPERRGNPVRSPFREDAHPSFSVFNDSRLWRDHGTGDHGDSFDFFQRATSQDAKSAFVGFVTLAGLGLSNELRSAPKKKSAAAVPTPTDARPMLILPSATVEFQECARNCFPALAKTDKYFVRGHSVVELVHTKEAGVTMTELTATALTCRLEEHFTLFKWIVGRDGDLVLKPSRCSIDSATRLLCTTSAMALPPLELIVNFPVFTERDGQLEILQKGYHNVFGGIYVLRNREITEIPIHEAVEHLLRLFDDYDFVSGADRSRAMAMTFSPAFRCGRLIVDDFPMDLGEADRSQSGKTYRQKFTAALYGERPYVLNKGQDHERGVGSMSEQVSAALLSGRLFLMMENIRGKVDCPILESALRGVETVMCRIAYARGVQVSTENVCWMLSSNRAEASPDLANRSIITQIRKRPEGYAYKTYADGLDLLGHIKANTDFYLSCIYSVIKYWHDKGKPHTSDTRHDFRRWCQTMDWIVQNVFSLPPLLDGHREEQNRLNNPALTWIREVALIVELDARLGEGLRPNEISDICENHGLAIPGAERLSDATQINMQTGRLLKRAFARNPEILVSGFRITRQTFEEYDPQMRCKITKHFHQFERLISGPF
jgi:Bifunctional DNA primase/polymerase, N-terminal